MFLLFRYSHHTAIRFIANVILEPFLWVASINLLYDDVIPNIL